MKKTILTLILVAGLLALQAQQSMKVVTVGLDQAPSFVTCGGRCSLYIIRGTGNSLSYLYAVGAENKVKVTRQNDDRGLALTSTNDVTHFTLTLDRDTLPGLFISEAEEGDVVLNLYGVVVANSRRMSGMELSEVTNLKGNYTTLVSTETHRLDSLPRMEPAQMKKLPKAPQKRRPYYGFDDRLDCDFLWAFHNWASTPYSGLMGVTEPGYSLRTTFSSYQVAVNYSLIMTRHFDMHIGFSYGSDVYKYGTEYIDLQGNTLVPLDAPQWAGYESRLVVRSLSLPVGLRLRTSDEGFKVDLTLLPGLNLNGMRTGLKHVYREDGHKQKDYTSLSGQLNPFLCDARITFQFNKFGCFLQLPTQPLFISPDMPKLYPVKIGFAM